MPPPSPSSPRVPAVPVSGMDEETRKRLEQEALDAGIQDPNRNLDKPELDKPAYGGGH
ncbi:hypothetical protein [Hymenobacter siberiensis]|uniref:hypothetical protein n=1 Tax=Hymenobacter siberiensis TaxID=2848396 RepID=UPI001C1E5CCD|nr:hypothetical protein [Hymenobacter siberiensis]MBU6119703.1 hypothetical protein [Hymenobacter siberiensis]